MNTGSFERLALVTAAAFLSACAAFEPDPVPPEYAAAPAAAPVWQAVGEVRQDDWLVLLNEGPAALDWRLTAIDSATQSIDLQTFLWEFDTTGAMVLDHLVAAADRGVRVRLLVDDSFLYGKDEIVLLVHRHPNIEYRVFNPYGRRSDSVVTREILNLGEFHRLDHRMHNKAMVVDNQVAIVGGRNLADEYFGLHGEANFRDLELLVGGPVARDVSAEFDKYWNGRWSVPIDALAHVETRPARLEEVRVVARAQAHLHEELNEAQRLTRWRNLAATGHAGMVTLYADAPPGQDPADPGSAPVQVADELVSLIDGARWEIVIASAYLIPTPRLEHTVERAVDRGVTVRLLTNSVRSNNHLTAHAAYRNHIRNLLGHGARLHEVRVDARDRPVYMLSPVEEKALALHAKGMVIDDDKVFIGSSNLDPRSLRINTEMGLLVESASLNAEVRRAIDPDFDPANAWRLELDGHGTVLWISDTQRLTTQPANSFMQNVEDWFFAHLPIEDEL